MDIVNRRKECRFPTDEIAEMRLSRLGYGKNIEIRVCDISKTGLRIQVKSQISEGCKVAIQMGEVLVTAEACRCRPIGPDLFEVGFRISEVKTQPREKSWFSWRASSPSAPTAPTQRDTEAA